MTRLHVDLTINGQRVVADAWITDVRNGWLALVVSARLNVPRRWTDEEQGERVVYTCQADTDSDAVQFMLERCADGYLRDVRIDQGVALEEAARALAREWRPSSERQVA